MSKREKISQFIDEIVGMTPDERELMQALAQIEKRSEYLTIDAKPVTLFAVVGALQLALRHQEFPLITAAMVRDYIEAVRQAMNHPVLDRIIAQGYDEQFDRPPGRSAAL